MEPMRRGPTVFDTNPIWQGKKNLLLKFAVIEEKHRFFFFNQNQRMCPPSTRAMGANQS